MDAGGRTWRNYGLLFAAWLITRLWLVAAGTFELPFYPGGPLAFDDLRVYARWAPAIEAGFVPSDDMWQYPPVSAFFFAIALLGSNPVTSLLVAIVLVDLILTGVLTRHDPRAGWYWVGAGVLIGPVLVARFDVVPTVFAVLAVLSAARPVRVGIWAAVGAMTKVWPVLIMVLVPPRRLLSGFVAFAATSAVLLGLCALLFDDVTGFLGGQSRRGLQVESVGALPFLVASAFGFDVELEYRYGSMEVASSGAGIAAVVVTVAAVVLFGWVFWCWLRGGLATRLPADVAFTVVLFSVVISRVFSPQYSVWLLGIGVLCLADPVSQVRGPVLMVAAAALIAQVLYPWAYGELLAGGVFETFLQVIRIVLVVTAAVVAGWRVCRPTPVTAHPPTTPSQPSVPYGRTA